MSRASQCSGKARLGYDRPSMERSGTAGTGISLLWSDVLCMDVQHSHRAFSTTVVSPVGWISCQETVQVHIVPPTRSANAYIFGRRLTSGEYKTCTYQYTVHRNLTRYLQSLNRYNASCQRLDSNGMPRTINSNWVTFPWPSRGNGSSPSR